MIEIDGSFGEGGGQILRTSLALSLVTGKPFRIGGVRAKRKKPGLRRQHLAAVLAAGKIGGARVEGAFEGSLEISFEPSCVKAGSYSFDVGTAGSATLVFQTVMPALLTAEAPSNLSIAGGTHNPFAPTFDFIESSFLPAAGRLGPSLKAALARKGFYPAGGGSVSFRIEPVKKLAAADFLERGELKGCRACIHLSKLPRHIADREMAVLSARLGSKLLSGRIRELDDSIGPGNAVVVAVESEKFTDVFSAVGERGLPGEKVAAAAADQALAYIGAGAPVGEHLADQLMLLFALAGGGSYRTGPLTPHSETNLRVLELFLGRTGRVEKQGDGTVVLSF